MALPARARYRYPVLRVSSRYSWRMTRRSYLLVIGEREALAWILQTEKMAFGQHRARDASGLSVGDELILVTTRGCFHNPTRDRTRLVGSARVTSESTPLDEPVRLAGREFNVACDFELKGLAPYLTGVELAPLVNMLEVFPNKRAWPIAMRRTLVRLPPADAQFLQPPLRRCLMPPAETVPGYLAAIKPVATASRA